jgi:hypothetical protein
MIESQCILVWCYITLDGTEYIPYIGLLEVYELVNLQYNVANSTLNLVKFSMQVQCLIHVNITQISKQC